MSEKKSGVFVNLVRKAVGLPTASPSCCGTTTASSESSCCGTAPAQETANSCCGTAPAENNTSSCCG